MGLARSLLLIALGGLASAPADAAPLELRFAFAGIGNGARAEGTIVFESTLLPNPGAEFFELPHPAVLSLDVAVSGAGAGNGLYRIGDFSGVAWETNGATLDLKHQVVGQATAGLPWGTQSAGGQSGDFNLFSGGQSGLSRYSDGPAGNSTAPNGIAHFRLAANGVLGEPMIITGLAPPGASSVPAVGSATLALLAVVLGMAAVPALRRRRVVVRA